MRFLNQPISKSSRELELLNKAKSTKGLTIDFGALEHHVKLSDMSLDSAIDTCHDSCCTHYRDLYKNIN